MKTSRLHRAGSVQYSDNMRTNSELIDYLEKFGYVTDEIAQAMLKYPREIFLPEYQKKNAYYDLPLLIGEEQTCSAPSMVGMMLSLLNIKKGMRVLEIGTGSGWQTALLCELVGDNGLVVSIELMKTFTDNVKRIFSKLDIQNAELVNGDGKLGYSKCAPYDRILVSAAAKTVHTAWKEQLKDGGVIILPLGQTQYSQYLYKGTKIKNDIALERIMPVAFVNLL